MGTTLNMCIQTATPAIATAQGTVVYKDAMPPEALSASDHFSSLLSSNVRNSVCEYGLMTAITAFALLMPSVADVEGSMPLREFALFMWVTSTFRKLYNSYLEAVWFSCPGYRTQPPREHALKKMKDLCGRERVQVETIDRHDFMTLLSQFALEVFIYYTFPGYYPAAQESYEPLWKVGVCWSSTTTYCPLVCTGCTVHCMRTSGHGRTSTPSTTGRAPAVQEH